MSAIDGDRRGHARHPVGYAANDGLPVLPSFLDSRCPGRSRASAWRADTNRGRAVERRQTAKLKGRLRGLTGSKGLTNGNRVAEVSPNADPVYPDESNLCIRLPENVQKHEIVNHPAKDWVRGDVHTGTIDGYWGLLKRGVIGSFYQISVKHLHRYLAEFQFHWNNRKSQDIFLLVITAPVIGQALTCKQLTASVNEQPNVGPEVELDAEPF